MRLGSLVFAGSLALGFVATSPDSLAQCFYGGGSSNGGNSSSSGNSSNGGTARGGSNSAGGGGSVVSNPGASTPAPTTGGGDGPSTGAPAAPGLPGGAGTAGPVSGGGPSMGGRGMALDLRRHEHSQKLLSMEWDYAAVLDAKKAEGPTSSESRMQSLTREEALAKLTGNDGRPMLILRECDGCQGSEVALFSRKVNNERTQVLAQFFHCIRFRPNVLAENHPFRKLFDDENPAHLMLLSADGATAIPFDGSQAQSDLWKGMLSLLKQEYVRPAEAAANQLANLMNEYDVVDLELKGLREALEGELEKDGSSHRAGTLTAKVRKVEAKLKDLEAREAKLLDLGLKRQLGAGAAGQSAKL